jgi:hypothetical protein
MTILNIRLTVDAENVSLPQSTAVLANPPKAPSTDREPVQIHFQMDGAEGWANHMNA